MRYLESIGIADTVFLVWNKVFPQTSQIANYLPLFSGVGLEIGGPSSLFDSKGLMPIYKIASNIDNVTFGTETKWEGELKPGRNYCFHKLKRPGYQYILEGNELSGLVSETYDFVISSHMLEHTSNPIKALKEWDRVLKTSGKLLLILPHRDGTFDHLRPITKLSHMVEDFNTNVDENDQTHFEEILKLHDLRRDYAQKSRVDFEEWILNNHSNRGAHHHVFDSFSAAELIDCSGFKIIAIEAIKPHHIFLLSEKISRDSVLDNSKFLKLDSNYLIQSPFKTDRLRSQTGYLTPWLLLARPNTA
jgi:SAM-dependent methyltransferase